MAFADKQHIEAIQASELFDEKWYLDKYPDVGMVGASAAEHYLWVGARMGRDPGPKFSTTAYLRAYPDIAASKTNPLLHFILHGSSEGRDPAPIIKPIDHSLAEDVDVVIPVFNALPDVQNCMKSVLAAKTTSRVRVIIVDDGSDRETVEWLSEFCSEHENHFILVKHETNRGYTFAVNSGLKRSSSPFVVLLNSDTIVTHGWVDALIRCAHSDSRIGIVGPLSNAASWQSVPTVLDEKGDFSVNPLPAGFTPDSMALLVSSVSRRDYPRVKFVNGFCFMIKRVVIDKIGYMDDSTFPQGYGEENDYCIRAHDSGFELAIADDCYVYHAKSKSFGHERRKELSANASKLLAGKHTEAKITKLLQETKNAPQLLSLRQRVSERFSCGGDAPIDVFQSKIVFILPVTGGGGGAHSVVQEVAEMRRMGIDAQVGVKQNDLERYMTAYPSLSGEVGLFVGIDFTSADRELASYDIVVATVYFSVDHLRSLREYNPKMRLFYYVQDYEPLFFPEGSPMWQKARESYTLVPGVTMFAKTHWIRQKVHKEHGVFVHKVSPSIDHSVYFPGKRSSDSMVRLAAMVRPLTPYRGATRTMRVLKKIVETYPEQTEVQIFGCRDKDIADYDLPRDFKFTNRGPLSREGVASLLRESDVFLDLSDYQAFGRTSLEAMACGCVPIIPAAGGGDEYAVPGENAEVVDTQDEGQAFSAAEKLVKSKEMRIRMRAAAIETAARYSPTLAAASELRLFAQQGDGSPEPRPDLHLISEARGDGKPTGSAFVRVLFPYTQPAIQGQWRIVRHEPQGLPGVNERGVALVQRSAVGKSEETLTQWLTAWRGRGNKMIFEIDDDLLNEAGLTKRGVKLDIAEMRRKIELLARNADLIVTSTRPLKTVMTRFNPNVEVIENYLDSKLWKLGEERDHSLGQYARLDGKIMLGYIGTPTHGPDLDLVKPVMQRLEKEFGNRISFEVIGAWQGGGDHFGTRVASPKNTDYPNFVEWLLKRVHWDIGIVPLVDDSFNASKSHLKFIEFAALDMAIVCSETPSYRGVARSGVNSLVVKNDIEAWYQALRKLIEDEHLRRSLARAARNLVKEEYTLEGKSAEYLTVLERVWSYEGRVSAA